MKARQESSVRRVRGRERRGRTRPSPVTVHTGQALAEVIADPQRPSARTLVLDGREAGQVDLADPRRLGFAYMRRIADLIDAFRSPGAGIDALHVGGGAFALPRYLAATRPASRPSSSSVRVVGRNGSATTSASANGVRSCSGAGRGLARRR